MIKSDLSMCVLSLSVFFFFFSLGPNHCVKWPCLDMTVPLQTPLHIVILNSNCGINGHTIHCRHYFPHLICCSVDVQPPNMIQFLRHSIQTKQKKNICWISLILPCSLHRWDQRFFLQGHISFWGRRTVPSRTLHKIQVKTHMQTSFSCALTAWQETFGLSRLPWTKCEWQGWWAVRTAVISSWSAGWMYSKMLFPVNSTC